VSVATAPAPRRAPPTAPKPPERRGALLRLVSAVHVFDPDAVPGYGGTECRALLARDADVVGLGSGRRGLSLRTEVRVHALAEHDGRASLLHAAKSIVTRPMTPTQRAFEHWLATGAFEGLDAATDVESLERIGFWLRSVPWAHDDAQRLQAEVARRQRVRGLEAIGGEHFVGRDEQRQVLHDFAVGGPGPEPEFVVLDAIGGMGKSALLARFELDLERDPAPEVTVHVDFDDVAIDVASPSSVLAQIFAQLGTELEEFRLYGDDLDALSAEGIGVTQFAQQANVAITSLSRLERTIAEANNKLRGALAAGRIGNLVIVLDTFERPLRRSRELAGSLLEMVWRIVAGIPGVVVIAGRGVQDDLARVSLPFSLHPVALREMPPKEARELLRRQGITDDSVAKKILELVPHRPLTLRLAARAEGVAKMRSGDKKLQDAVSRELVDGFLHLRILDHLDEPRIARLVHPGFVLRRITPALVLEVLKDLPEPPVADGVDANELFEGLRRVNDLVVERTDRPGLALRDEIRRELLALMREDDADAVARLHDAAAAYFADHPELPGARVEAAYHRLMLVKPRQKGIERLLAGLEPDELTDLLASAGELPEGAAAVVRRLAQPGDPSGAAPAVPESIADLRRRFTLLVNEGHYKEADDFVARQGPFEDFDLLWMEARLRRKQHRKEVALDAARRARARLPTETNVRIAVELSLIEAWADPAHGTKALRVVKQAVEDGRNDMFGLERLAAAADGALIAETVPDARGMFDKVVRDCLREVSDTELRSSRVILLAAAAASRSAPELARALDLGALDELRDVTRTMLVATMLDPLRAAWKKDDSMGRLLDPPTSASQLTKTLRSMIRGRTSPQITEAIARVLAEEYRAATTYVDGRAEARARALKDTIDWIERKTSPDQRGRIVRSFGSIGERIGQSRFTAESMVLIYDREQRLVELFDALCDALPVEAPALLGLRHRIARPPGKQWIEHDALVALLRSLQIKTEAAARRTIKAWKLDWVFQTWKRPPVQLVGEALELLNMSGKAPATVLKRRPKPSTHAEVS
jgi:hypothetical protein